MVDPAQRVQIGRFGIDAETGGIGDGVFDRLVAAQPAVGAGDLGDMASGGTRPRRNR